MTVLAEYVAAAIIELAVQAPDERISLPREELPLRIEQAYGLKVTEELFSKALRILNRCDISYIAEDEFAGAFVTVSRRRFDDFLANVRADLRKYDEIVISAMDENLGLSRAEDRKYAYLDLYNRYDAIKKYSQFGSSWLQSALEKIKLIPAGQIEIPASDRVVRLDHNDPTLIQIISEASQLRQKILKGNDLGDITSDQAKALANEVQQLENDFKSDVLRPEVVTDRARKSLKWISDKAAGTMVGQAAWRLLLLIAQFFGFSI